MAGVLTLAGQYAPLAAVVLCRDGGLDLTVDPELPGQGSRLREAAREALDAGRALQQALEAELARIAAAAGE